MSQVKIQAFLIMHNHTLFSIFLICSGKHTCSNEQTAPLTAVFDSVL